MKFLCSLKNFDSFSEVKALADGIIKDRMIGQGEIGGNKINISSMIEEVNKESNTKTIKGMNNFYPELVKIII